MATHSKALLENLASNSKSAGVTATLLPAAAPALKWAHRASGGSQFEEFWHPTALQLLNSARGVTTSI